MRAGRSATGLPDWLWVGAAAGLLTLAIGSLGIWVGSPLLFPSIGPTVILQVQTPELKSARLYNVVVGHGVGVAAAMLAVVLLQAGSEPAAMSHDMLTWPRVHAAAFALTVGFMLQVALGASHPPAAATILLIALGGFEPAWKDVAVLATGIFLLALLGEPLRRVSMTRMVGGSEYPH